MKRTLALFLSALMMLPACAARRAAPVATGPEPPPRVGGRVDPALMAGYIRQLRVGSRVRVDLASDRVIHGILMKNDADPIVVQRRTRIPETPMEIAVRDILAVELEPASTNPGRNIAIGAAAAVGATLGVLLLLAAIFSD